MMLFVPPNPLLYSAHLLRRHRPDEVTTVPYVVVIDSTAEAAEVALEMRSKGMSEDDGAGISGVVVYRLALPHGDDHQPAFELYGTNLHRANRDSILQYVDEQVPANVRYVYIPAIEKVDTDVYQSLAILVDTKAREILYINPLNAHRDAPRVIHIETLQETARIVHRLLFKGQVGKRHAYNQYAFVDLQEHSIEWLDSMRRALLDTRKTDYPELGFPEMRAYGEYCAPLACFMADAIVTYREVAEAAFEAEHKRREIKWAGFFARFLHNTRIEAPPTRDYACYLAACGPSKYLRDQTHHIGPRDPARLFYVLMQWCHDATKGHRREGVVSDSRVRAELLALIHERNTSVNSCEAADNFRVSHAVHI